MKRAADPAGFLLGSKPERISLERENSPSSEIPRGTPLFSLENMYPASLMKRRLWPDESSHMLV